MLHVLILIKDDFKVMQMHSATFPNSIENGNDRSDCQNCCAEEEVISKTITFMNQVYHFICWINY